MSLVRRWSVTAFAAALTAIPILAATVVVMAPTPTASAGDKDCSDFRNQRAAQRYFRKHHPRQDPSGLDADHDGIACEDNPCPCNHRWPHGFVARITLGAPLRVAIPDGGPLALAHH